MATPVIMPRQGQSVESCIISNWAKNVGDKVVPGDTLFTYETDKATFDEEAKVEGTMLVHFFEEGDDVPCLQTSASSETRERISPYFLRTGRKRKLRPLSRRLRLLPLPRLHPLRLPRRPSLTRIP